MDQDIWEKLLGLFLDIWGIVSAAVISTFGIIHDIWEEDITDDYQDIIGRMNNDIFTPFDFTISDNLKIFRSPFVVAGKAVTTPNRILLRRFKIDVDINIGVYPGAYPGDTYPGIEADGEISIDSIQRQTVAHELTHILQYHWETYSLPGDNESDSPARGICEKLLGREESPSEYDNFILCLNSDFNNYNTEEQAGIIEQLWELKYGGGFYIKEFKNKDKYDNNGWQPMTREEQMIFKPGSSPSVNWDKNSLILLIERVMRTSKYTDPS